MRGSRETADPKSRARPLHSAALLCAIVAPLVLAGWLETEPTPAESHGRAIAAPPPAPRGRVDARATPLPEPAARLAPLEPSPAPADLASRAPADTRRIEARGGFTLQFAVMCREENVRQILAELTADPRLFVLPAAVDGRTCHRLCYGTYPSEAAAREARDVPSALRAITASPRAVRVAQVVP